MPSKGCFDVCGEICDTCSVLVELDVRLRRTEDAEDSPCARGVFGLRGFFPLAPYNPISLQAASKSVPDSV